LEKKKAEAEAASKEVLPVEIALPKRGQTEEN